jgi:hypothetical protein
VALTDGELKAAARRAYEYARLGRAVAVSAPVAVLPLTSFFLGTSGAVAAALGVALVGGVLVLVWRGGGLAFGGATGLKAGLLPLALAHAAKSFGHVCTPAGCTTLCVPACAAGGVLAGALVEWWARRSSRPTLTRLVGACVAFLTGALGCSCVGYAGMAALFAALAASMMAGRLVPARA